MHVHHTDIHYAQSSQAAVVSMERLVDTVAVGNHFSW